MKDFKTYLLILKKVNKYVTINNQSYFLLERNAFLSITYLIIQTILIFIITCIKFYKKQKLILINIIVYYAVIMRISDGLSA